jgi:TPR repeat protein
VIDYLAGTMRARRMKIASPGRLILVGALLVRATALLPDAPAFALELQALEQQAASGDADALFQLADRYERGDQVEQDLGLAATLLQAAAERGHAGAQYRLGLMQAAGVGIDPDPVQSFAWATLAADAEGTTGLLASSLQAILQQDLDHDQVARAEDLVAGFSPVTGPFDLPASGAGEGLSSDGGALDLPETGCGRLQVAEEAQGPLLITGAVAEDSAMASLVDQTLAATLERLSRTVPLKST